ncbi:hypothetical protein ACFCQI_01585 [Rhodanobacter sp. FW102-FHT14D06]|uniref:Ubiquitin-activating enzyme E1 FCCH domain-containing protein n=2 Tax=unclassified Rhodanobacter TaxID=2621553 RepID=A0AB74UXH1_9GAMM
MADQGWTVDATAHTITFYQPPANGAAISVKQYAQGGINATAVWALGAWGPHTGYPGEVEYFAGRLWFAGTDDRPQTAWTSKISNYSSFGKSVPTADDDAITATLSAKQVNAITDLLPLKDLVMLTTGAEWKIAGGSNNVITPSTVSFSPQSNYGASSLPGLVVGDSGLFVQGRGAYVRDIGYQFAVDSYTGNDLTVFASHLVQGHTIVDWAYQQTPFSVVWAVRDDGVLLGLAYMREQQVMGWFHCDTINGFVESVCSVSEGTEDAVYLIVRRVINGTTVRYVERLETRFFADQRDGFFVDAGLSYDGRSTALAPGATMTLTGGITWMGDEDLTLTCSTAIFAASNLGNWVKLYADTVDANGSPQTVMKPVKITAYTSATVVTVRPVGLIDTALRNTALTAWDFCPLTFSGLDHLEGQSVACLADGNVKPRQTVTSGQITLDAPAAVVHIGLPIQADFETLEVNALGQESVRDRRKAITKVSLIVTQSRGAKIGKDADHLREAKSRRVSDGYYNPNSLQNDLIEAYIDADWDTKGRVFVRQDDPLPLTILGLIADVSVAGG